MKNNRSNYAFINPKPKIKSTPTKELIASQIHGTIVLLNILPPNEIIRNLAADSCV